MELIHESQILVAQLPQFGLGKLGNFLPHQRNAAGTGFVQTAQQMQQRGFAAARRADNAHAFARLDLQRQIMQHVHIQAAVLIGFADFLTVDDPITHNAMPPQVVCAPRSSLDTAWR